ncbi:MAG: sigma-70 family RNA polymerase sigma factor [Planctomycetes bacterium]|nr:sigma-70 family RNA polymerase sigma factor [Planctomycetota bacterium]
MTRDTSQDAGTPTLVLCERIAREADEAAFQILYRRHYERIRRSAILRLGRSWTPDPSDVDDALQEAFLYAWNSIQTGGFDPKRSEGGFRNWIARIATHKVVDAKRGELTLKRGGGAVKSFRDVFRDTISEFGFAASGPSPSSLAGLGELGYGFDAALLRLGDKHRRVIDMRFFCEMSFDEIAVELEYKSTGAVRALLHRALSELRRHVDPSGAR